MTPELITAVTGLVVAVGAVISAVTAAYFKLRDKVDVVKHEVNSRYTELFARLDDMTAQRDAALDSPRRSGPEEAGRADRPPPPDPGQRP